MELRQIANGRTHTTTLWIWQTAKIVATAGKSADGCLSLSNCPKLGLNGTGHAPLHITRWRENHTMNRPANLIPYGLPTLLVILLSTAPATAATVNWLPDADGAWATTTNWDSHPSLPGAGDDVVIDVGGATVRNIAISQNRSVLSVQSRESLNLNGGTLTVGAGGGQIDGIAINAGGRLFSDDGILSAPIASLPLAGWLSATNGGRLDLPALTTLMGASSTPARLDAAGINSVLDLSNVTTFEAGNSWDTDIVATGGGRVDLSNVSAITVGTIDVFASDANSLVDLSSLDTYTPTHTYQRAFGVENGGSIQLGNILSMDATNISINNGTLTLPQLTSFINGTLAITNAAPNLSTVTDLQNSSLTLNTGASLSLPALTNFDEASLAVRDGATFTTPASASSYQGKSTNPSTLQADGAGSLLDLSHVTSFEAGNNWDTNVNAWNGGRVDLSGVTAITLGSIDVHARDANSVVDLSNLVTYSPTNAFERRFRAENGGNIQLGNVQVMDGTTIVIDNGTMSTSQITTFTNGAIIVASAAPISPR